MDNSYNLEQSGERLLSSVWGIINRAGWRIIDMGDAGREIISTTADGQPTIRADLTSQELILPALGKLGNVLPIVSQDQVAAEGMPFLVPSSPFWLVDPLDGSKRYAEHGKDAHTIAISIALIDRNKPVMGVLHFPFLGETIGACSDSSAIYVGDDGCPQLLDASRTKPENPRAVVSGRSLDEATLMQKLADYKADIVEADGHADRLRKLLKGEADLYIRLKPSLEWDTAAAHMALINIGGQLEQLDGRDILYGKNGFLNPAFIARTWHNISECPIVTAKSLGDNS